MKYWMIRGLASAMIAGCLLMTACGEDKAEKTQGFTQSLEEEQEKADEALETFEEASEALEEAIRQEDNE